MTVFRFCLSLLQANGHNVVNLFKSAIFPDEFLTPKWHITIIAIKKRSPGQTLLESPAGWIRISVRKLKNMWQKYIFRSENLADYIVLGKFIRCISWNVTGMSTNVYPVCSESTSRTFTSLTCLRLTVTCWADADSPKEANSIAKSRIFKCFMWIIYDFSIYMQLYKEDTLTAKKCESNL